jgi:hypothetical protein
LNGELIRFSVPILIILILAILYSALADDANIDWSKIFDGDVIVEAVQNREGIPGVRALFVVSASRERIWGVLLDYDNFSEIFAGIDKIKVLEQDEHGAHVEFWIDAILKNYHYVLYRHYEKRGRRLTWKQISGDLKSIEGSWEIRDTSRSGIHLLVYESYVEVAGVIPTSLVRWTAMRKAHEMGERLRHWIENR